MSSPQDVWPTELRVVKERDALTAVFDNGESYTICAELLRVQSGM